MTTEPEVLTPQSVYMALRGRIKTLEQERADLRAQVDALQPPVVPDYDARETRAYAEGYRRAVYDVLNRLPQAARV